MSHMRIYAGKKFLNHTECSGVCTIYFEFPSDGRFEERDS